MWPELGAQSSIKFHPDCHWVAKKLWASHQPLWVSNRNGLSKLPPLKTDILRHTEGPGPRNMGMERAPPTLCPPVPALPPLPELHVASPRATERSRRRGFTGGLGIGDGNGCDQNPLSSRGHQPTWEGLWECANGFPAATGAASLTLRGPCRRCSGHMLTCQA